MDDFNLCGDRDELQLLDAFPPILERLTWEVATRDRESHGWMFEYGKIELLDSIGYDWLKFYLKDKDAIFKKIEDLGCTVRYSSKLELFETRFDYGWGGSW